MWILYLYKISCKIVGEQSFQIDKFGWFQIGRNSKIIWQKRTLSQLTDWQVCHSPQRQKCKNVIKCTEAASECAVL